jgi:hypothetical protein
LLLLQYYPKERTIDVPSVDEYAQKIPDKDDKVLMSRMPIPTVGWFATCQDTEGNVFGIILFDQNAK